MTDDTRLTALVVMIVIVFPVVVTTSPCPTQEKKCSWPQLPEVFLGSPCFGIHIFGNVRGLCQMAVPIGMAGHSTILPEMMLAV